MTMSKWYLSGVYRSLTQTGIVNSRCTITFHSEVFIVVINQPLIQLMDAQEVRLQSPKAGTCYKTRVRKINKTKL